MKTMKTKPPFWRDQRGMALVVTLLLVTVFLTLGVYGLQYSTLDAKIANNHTTGTQALSVAESGLAHALQTINRIGVVNFQSDVVARWNTLFSPNPKALPNNPNLTYHVQVASSAGDPANAGTIIITASGQSKAKRVIRANVRRMPNLDGRGALYLASDSVNPTFNGSAFEINGNDHNLAGQIVQGGEVKPGIATRNDTVTNDVKGALNNNQISSVQGLGYSTNPKNASVITGGGPSVADLNQIISDILARPGVVTNNGSNITGNSTLGTCASPKITHLTAGDVTLAGTVSGCGILIADGSVKITGNLDFTGWIIVRGETEINAVQDGKTTVLGNATIVGSLWTGDLNVRVGGSAVINYSTAALQLVDAIDNGGSPIPRAMMITSWAEHY
jgi:Tfp pilus assembly protein PilX/cytoskeletal protein CcmA (bactofilin family)